MNQTKDAHDFKGLAAESFQFKADLAKRTDIPVDLLEQLSKDSMAWIRANVGRNPNTPVTILMELINDEDEMVRMATLRNPTLQKEPKKEVEDDGLPMFLRAKPKPRYK